ncbi:helix-turn-helix transcriptional regulator [Homoserinimonas sp. A447]
MRTSEWEASIGETLRQLRIENEFTQAQLAERANLSRSAVQGLELGSGSRLHTLIAVLRALDRLDLLLQLLPEEGPSPMELLRLAKKTHPERYRSR